MRLAELKLGRKVRRNESPINPSLNGKTRSKPFPIGIAESYYRKGTKYYVVVVFENERREEILLDRLEYSEES
jgi:hypothetical protein